MIAEGLAWLKDMATARLNPPSPIVRAEQEHQGMRYTPQPVTREPEPTPPMETARAAVDAMTPRPRLQHTVPPQQSATFRGPEYGCVGLCIGGTCAVCDGLAAEIGRARHIRVPAIREIREGALLRRINTLRGNQ